MQTMIQRSPECPPVKRKKTHQKTKPNCSPEHLNYIYSFCVIVCLFCLNLQHFCPVLKQTELTLTTNLLCNQLCGGTIEYSS